MPNSTLYLVATPIGNLNEISSRQKETLEKVDFIACENPHNSLTLLKHLGISKKLIQVNAVHEEEMSNQVIELLRNHKSVAFMSDAGYPCISDPGYLLVKKAIENNINITVINGSSAFLTALVASGIDASRFTFVGFLSAKEGTLTHDLEEYKNNKETLIFYESSHRIQKFIECAYKVFGNRKCCIARELTKLHEEYIRSNLGDLLSLTDNQQKGEFVVIIEGNSQEETNEADALIAVQELVKLGLKIKDACEYISKKTGMSKKYLYDNYHKM